MRAICPRTWLTGLVVSLGLIAGTTAFGGNVTLDFSDVPAGTLVVFNPYESQGFRLMSGGFAFNSPDTGNGASQPIGNNPFYAGANGLAAFVPATITLTQINGDPFSFLSIDLARNFAFDPPPSVTFTGTFAGGGTVTKTFGDMTTPPPFVFSTFDLGFTNVTSVSWDQGASTQGIHQFGNIRLSTEVIPEPSAATLLAVGITLAMSLRGLARTSA